MQVYEALGEEFCTAFDVAVGMGGCESVVEGFYSTMSRHQFTGGQSNDTLVDRAIIDWLFPAALPLQSPSTMRSVATL